MPPIVTTAEIDRPAAQVFACATDPSLFPQWQKGVEGGHLDAPDDGTLPPVGSKCMTTRRIGGSSRQVTSELFAGHGIGKVLVPLMVRREARKEMPENMAAL